MSFDVRSTNRCLESIVLEDLASRYGNNMRAMMANEILSDQDLKTLVSFNWDPENQVYRETNEHVKFAVPQKAIQVSHGDLDTLREWVINFVRDSIDDIDKTQSGTYDYENSGAFSRFVKRKPKLKNYPMPEIEVFDSPSSQYNVRMSDVVDPIKVDLGRFVEYYSTVDPRWTNLGNTKPATIEWYMFLWGMFKKGQIFTAEEDIQCLGTNVVRGDELEFLHIKNWSRDFSTNPLKSRAIAVFRSQRGIHGIPYGQQMSTYLVVVPTTTRGSKYPKKIGFNSSKISRKYVCSMISAKVHKRWNAILAAGNPIVQNYSDDYSIVEEKNWWDSLTFFDRNHDYGFRQKAGDKWEQYLARQARDRQEEIDEQTDLYNRGQDNYLRILPHGRRPDDKPKNSVMDHAQDILNRSIHGDRIPLSERIRAKEDLKRERERLFNMRRRNREVKELTRIQKEREELDRLLQEFEENFPY